MSELRGQGSRAPLPAARAPPGPIPPSAALPAPGGAVARGRRHPLDPCRKPCASSTARYRPPGPRPCLTRRGCRTWPLMCSAYCWVRTRRRPEGRMRAGGYGCVSSGRALAESFRRAWGRCVPDARAFAGRDSGGGLCSRGNPALQPAPRPLRGSRCVCRPPVC